MPKKESHQSNIIR